MLGLLNLFTRTRTPQPRSTPWRTARPWLEQLESRDAPSTLTLSLTMNGLKSVTLSGDVTADNPAGQRVTISGAASTTVFTNSTGHFSKTVNANRLGDVTAVATDSQGVQSNTALVTIAVAAPVISNFGWCNEVGIVTFTGTVTHPDVASGLVVTITGALTNLGPNGVTTTTGSDGSFSTSITVATNESSSVYATVVDCWGQQSNVASNFVV